MNRGRMASASSYTWATVAMGRSAGRSTPAFLRMHGFLRISSSSTAVRMIVLSSRYAFDTVDRPGLPAAISPACHARTRAVERLPSSTSPNVGRMCSRRKPSYSSCVRGRSSGRGASQPQAYSGQRHVPRPWVDPRASALVGADLVEVPAGVGLGVERRRSRDQLPDRAGIARLVAPGAELPDGPELSLASHAHRLPCPGPPGRAPTEGRSRCAAVGPRRGRSRPRWCLGRSAPRRRRRRPDPPDRDRRPRSGLAGRCRCGW